MAQIFDEGYFEPKGEAGNVEMVRRMLGPGTPSNEQGISMSQTERSVRERTYQ